MIITKEQLSRMMPTCASPETWAPLLSQFLEMGGITTSQQAAYFIAQCGHESNSFNVLKENLNYGAVGLETTFKKYFGPKPKADVNAYARNQEKIANLVYANRIGNGPESSGDGWKFRGRGLVQCTGRSNYAECSQFIFGDDTLLNNPDKLLEPEYALKSALWFWSKHGLEKVTDFTTLTQKINGGQNGSDDRFTRMVQATKVLG